MPRVLNKYRDQIPKGAIYIGRGSPWGNPYSHLKGSKAIVVPTRELAIDIFRTYAIARNRMKPHWLEPLRGKDLVCYCKPLSCHGDVLLELLEKGIDTHEREG